MTSSGIECDIGYSYNFGTSSVSSYGYGSGSGYGYGSGSGYGYGSGSGWGYGGESDSVVSRVLYRAATVSPFHLIDLNRNVSSGPWMRCL